MNTEEFKILISEGEGLTVEFKEKYASRIAEDIVAFSNAKGGYILLGVNDHGKITGAWDTVIDLLLFFRLQNNFLKNRLRPRPSARRRSPPLHVGRECSRAYRKPVPQWCATGG